MIRKTAGRSFNHSLISAGFVAGGVKRGDSKGRRDAYSAIVWYWRGEGLLTSINPNRQAQKDVELEKRTYFPSWIGFTCMTRALVSLAGSPFREPVSTYLPAKLLLQLQPSI